MTIAETLSQLAAQNRKALVPFSTVADPNRDVSLEIFRSFGDWGADFVELGIPYSDPLMDGPTLQRSYTRTLKAGFKLALLPGFIEDVRRKSDIPMLVMTCFNPILQYGVERFFRDMSSAGVDALLVTDLPLEEWGGDIDLARHSGLGTVFLVTPTTSTERMKKLDAVSDPFVYCVSKAGVTGGGHALPDELVSYTDTVRSTVTRPVLIGFGISTPEQARTASGLAHGVIIGSAIADIIEKNLDSAKNAVSQVGDFIKSVRQAMDS